jgi:hypothetical protein
LKNGTAEEKIKATEELADLGEKALPAARSLCEAAMEPSQKVSRAALQALEKVHPELQQAVFVLLVDAKAENHKQALSKLSLLGEQGKPAVPVLTHRIKTCQEQLSAPQAAWGQPTLVEVTELLLETLTKVAPEDPKVVKTMIDAEKFSTPRPLFLFGRRGRNQTNTPFREECIRLLGELAEGQPEHRKQIVPPLVAALKEAVQQTKTDQEDVLLQAIVDVDLAGTALLKCGPEAKPTLTKEVLPRLKDLQFHKSDRVRATAEELRKKIEDAP